MFYSQFILAKKGPLGTIWIAAHLERKLRKNQVADTDIGVSVDSILFPDVPIALRLSSHLLLGVVRIYSRKVNYLFDDCSEALLKIKQAFRSTAVDLPPEESTAPYHSITLPETFDLDDFELPDNDIFQGNFVDHHVSSREQITLQDTMEGVVYSTSQFGLDERFGDGDTSGLDLDEDLLAEKVGAVEHAGGALSSDADPQTSVQSITPLKHDENQLDVPATLESMPANGIVNQMEDFDGDNDHVEYAQAPCTPGLWEEPNLPNIQETSACDDHLESENHYVTESTVKENLGNAYSKSDSYIGHKSVVDWPLVNDTISDSALCLSSREAGPDDQEHNQFDPQEKSPLDAGTMENISTDNFDIISVTHSVLADQVRAILPVTELSNTIITAPDGSDRTEDLQNVNASIKGPETHSVDENHKYCVEPLGRLNENISHVSNLTSSCQPIAEGISENNQASLEAVLSNNMEIAGDLEKTSHLSNGESYTESLNRCNLDEQETKAFQEPKDSKILIMSLHHNMPCTDTQVLRPCITHLNQHHTLTARDENSIDADLPSDNGVLHSLETFEREEPYQAYGASALVQGAGTHVTDAQSILEETHVTEPASHDVIQGASNISNDQGVDVILGDIQVENTSFSSSSDFPALEKLLSVPEGISDVQKNLLPVTTPVQEVLAGNDGGDARSGILAGKKRSFTESSLTVQSLNLVESSGVFNSKIIADFVPDDDDLLSSILVGRRSSVLKVKPTPIRERTSTKRRRSAPSISATKRKVLMDDTMVLHGDTICQQLTNTEDIRRLRKKAPCTRPEISMIQKQFWEDELFSEAIFTGVSMELASLHNQAYDLSNISISQNEASFEGAMDPKLIPQNEENGVHLEVGTDRDASIGQNVLKGNGDEASFGLIAITDGCESHHVETPIMAENQPCENYSISSDCCGTHVQMHPTSDVTEHRSSEDEHLGRRTAMEIDRTTISDADVGIPTLTVQVESLSHDTDGASGDTYDVPARMVQLASFEKPGDTDAYLPIDTSAVQQDEKLEVLPVEMDSCADISSNKAVETNVAAEVKVDVDAVEAISEAKDEFLLEKIVGDGSVDTIMDITDCLEHTQAANASGTFSPETDGVRTQFVNVDQDVEEIRKNEQEVVNEDAVLDPDLEYNANNLVSNDTRGEERVMISCEEDVNVGLVSLDDRGNPIQQEAYLPTMGNVDISAIDRDNGDDLDYSAIGPDTEFLNVDDDDEVGEADGDFMPNAKETRFIENSGWSSRTKAVAKYLQTLFEKEAERGRKVLPVNNLLAGKTRKEASRMFFEALVLKTKDYIHVDQRNPFDSINILPRTKLMKSDF